MESGIWREGCGYVPLVGGLCFFMKGTENFRAGWGNGERVFREGVRRRWGTLVSRGSSCDIPRMQMGDSVMTAGARKTPPAPRLSELTRGGGWRGGEVGYWYRFEDPRGESCLQQGP